MLLSPKDCYRSEEDSRSERQDKLQTFVRRRQEIIHYAVHHYDFENDSGQGLGWAQAGSECAAAVKKDVS
jgi:hypothetical protein